jgi:hypothetical protein
MVQGNGRGGQIVVLVDEQERALKSPEAAAPSAADAVRRWSAKLGHPIQGVGREDCPLWPAFLECEPDGVSDDQANVTVPVLVAGSAIDPD